MIDGINAANRASYGHARYSVNDLVSMRFDCESSAAVESGGPVVARTLVSTRRITIRRTGPDLHCPLASHIVLFARPVNVNVKPTMKLSLCLDRSPTIQ
jgi:hypothetical protein